MIIKSWEIVMLTNILVCSAKKLESKIVGGDFAKISQFPHSVYLAAFCHNENWGCGSSILTDSILLTAAHCLDTCVGRFKIDAYAGTTDVEHVNYIRPVKKYIMHERYDSNTAFSDIALTLLKRPLELGSTTKRVIIKRSFPQDSDALMAGWGDISDDGDETFMLKQVRQKVQATSTCSKAMTILWGMMCASSGTPDDYPASGDSGSALIRYDFQQIGIVSMKTRGRHISLVVYTNVSYFFDWIEEKSALLYCSTKTALRL